MRPSHAVAGAEEFLLETIRNHSLSAGGRLPTLDRLSKLSGLSRVTVSKAVNRLKQQGVLTSRRGGFIAVAGVPHEPDDRSNYTKSAPASAVPPRARRGHHVQAALEKDILRGRFAPGTQLPSRKELTYLYGASYPTLKKALSAVCREGIIRPYHRGFVVPTLDSPQHGSLKVVLLGQAHEERKEAVRLIAGGEELLRTLERGCAQSRIALEMVAHSRVDNGYSLTDCYRAKPYSLRDDPSVAGFIVIVPYDETESTPVLRDVYPFAKPVAVVTNGAPRFITRLFPARFPLRVFSVGVSQDAGMKVAQYCLNRAHERVAYVSPFHGSDWSVQRCAGLVSLYEKAGFPNAVRAYTLPFSVSEFTRRCAGEFPPFFCRNWDLTQEYLLSPDSSATRIRRSIDDLFKQALTDAGCTAWVTANDLVASLALDYLGRRGRRVPDIVSLVSFDDSRRALRKQITSYNFNLSALAHACLEFVLGRPRASSLKGSRVISLEGMIVRRGSMRSLH